MKSPEYINDAKKLHERVTNESAEKTDSLFRHILLVTLTLFGVIVSLHKNTGYNCWIQFFYITSLVLLVIVIISSVIIISSQTRMTGKARNEIEKDLKELIVDGKEMKDSYGSKDKYMGYYCNICLVALCISVITLLAYSLLSVN